MATRDELVRVGIQLLEAEGLAALSLRRIAAAAGVSHGAPRHHFPTYGSLLAAIARRGVEDLDEVLAPALAGAEAAGSGERGEVGDGRSEAGAADSLDTSATLAAPTPAAARGAVVEAARAYVGFAQERPEMFELIHRHDRLGGQGGNLRELTAPWFASLARCVELATGDADPHLAAALWAGVHGLAVLTSRRTMDPVTPSAPDVDVTLARLLAGLLGR